MQRSLRSPLMLLLLPFLLLAGYASNSAEAAEENTEETPFYLTVDTPPAPELTPREALQSFALAPGFRIELVAAEPLVEDPVAIAWDELGDLYVVEMRGFMPDAWGRGADEPVGAVVRLTDTNADGQFDHRQVLMDKLVLPRALAVVNEGLLVAEPPNLWLCPGKPGTSTDIDCTKRTRVAEYGNQPGSVEHAENGLLLAVDNWLYNAKSDRRLKLVDGQLREEQTLFRGQWGITQDNDGQLYYNTNSNLLLGDVYDAQPMVEAGNTAAAGLGIQVSRQDQVFAIRTNPGVNRAYVPGVLREDGRLDKPTSASGMVVYRGGQFPSSYENHENDVFVTEPAANVVVRLKLDAGGLQANAEHVLYDDDQWGRREFLASTDERFRPVDVDVGPDGALYVVDMYRGIIQDIVFLTDELREHALSQGLDKPVGLGRIWRISAEGQSIQTKEMPEDVNALIARLDDANGWQRDTAQRLLIGSEARGIDRELRKLATRGSTIAAVHALWTLEGRGALRRSDVQKALNHEASSVRVAALRAGHETLKQDELLALTGSDDETVAHHATLYLAPYNNAPAVLKALADILTAHEGNAVRTSAVKAALRGNEDGFLDYLRGAGEGLETEWKEARLAFVKDLVTQAFREEPGMGAGFLDSTLVLSPETLQKAVLLGLYQVTREEDFERVVLDAPHPVFTDLPEALWPVVSRTRRAFTWSGDDLAADLRPLSKLEKTRKGLGREYYAERCAICHGPNGEGIGSAGPPLMESEWVTGPTEKLLRVILHGLHGPIEVKGDAWNSVMPGHDTQPALTDEVASGLITYLHRAWGHVGRAVDPGFVQEIRESEAGRMLPWTAEELEVIPLNTHYRDYAGAYGGGNFLLQFHYEENQLIVQSVFFNGPMVEAGEDQFFFEPRPFTAEFVRDPTGTVVAVRLPGQDDAIVPRVAN